MSKHIKHRSVDWEFERRHCTAWCFFAVPEVQEIKSTYMMSVEEQHLYLDNRMVSS